MAKNTVMIAVAARMARFQLIALRVAESGITTFTTAMRSLLARSVRGVPAGSVSGVAAASPIMPRYLWQPAQLLRHRIGW